jgi:hypothetical protein
MRIRIPGSSPGLLKEVRDRLLATHGVRSADINPTTGSVLIHYFHNDGIDFTQSIAERVADLIAFATESRNATDAVGDYSTTAISLLKTVKQADDELRARSGGRIDLKLLFPLAMVGLTAITLPTSLQTPLWLSFLMFGFSSFESMHTGALEQPAGKLGEEHESNAAGGAAQG